ncbi:MAG: S41 family peptidase, partial [Planctomycetota bacterium]
VGATKAEREGRWLIANELFYRLDQLTEDAAEFEDDSDRLNSRLAMIRLYAPERFHELRNERRALEDEDPLPAFNAIGQDFREKTRGINEYIVKKAIERAASRHVDREKIALADLVVSGFEEIKTMVSTDDLYKAFPGIADDQARTRFVAFLDAQTNKLRGESNRARYGRYDLNASISQLMQMNKRTVRVLEEALLHEFGNGAMSVLDDYSAVIWPDELRRFQRSTQGRFVGVGIQIQSDEELNIKVVTPLEGAPAQRAGIRAGDVVTKVNGESTAGFDLNQAVDVITGPEGTDVTLTVERGLEDDAGEPIEDGDGEPVTEEIDFTITRANIKLASVKGWKRQLVGEERWDWHIDEDHGIGYVRLTQFAPDTADDFDDAIRDMRASAAGLNGLILDLRFNPGGLLDQAVEISNKFVPSGLIVQTVDADGNVTERHTANRRRASLNNVPVVVLINEGSASASEIVSGAVRHYSTTGQLDAVLIGDRTFGKGSVQNVWALPGNQTAQKLTTQYYTLPSGRIIHRKPGSAEWGVDPNLQIAQLPEKTTEAILKRMAADVITLDKDGNVMEPDEPRPEPQELLTEGLDLQLHTALVLLQSRNADAAHAALDTPTAPVSPMNN